MATALRIATDADSDRLAAMHAAAFPPTDAWSRDVFSLQLGLPNVVGLWTVDGLILIRVADCEAEILTLAVTPDSRRRGVATTMLQEALVRLAVARAVVVFLEVSVKNTAALALYTRSGFSPVGRRTRYYSDGSDALVMRLDLSHDS